MEFNLISLKDAVHPHWTECDGLKLLHTVPWKRLTPEQALVVVVSLPPGCSLFTKFLILVPCSLPCFLSAQYPQILSFWVSYFLFFFPRSENLPSTFDNPRTAFSLAFVSWFCLGSESLIDGGTRKPLRSPPSDANCLYGLHLFWILILLSWIGSIPACWTVSLLLLYSILIRHQLFETHYCPKIKSHGFRVGLAEIFISEKCKSDHISLWLPNFQVFHHTLIKISTLYHGLQRSTSSGHCLHCS